MGVVVDKHSVFPSNSLPLFLFVLLQVSFSQGLKRQFDTLPEYPFSYKEDDNTLPIIQEADDRTIISDIIGFSALKFMLLFLVPMIFSIFLGAMLVLLFPFPLLTSTAGLAGAAAVGRRQGRIAPEDEESLQVLQLLGIPPDPHHTGSRRVKKQFKSVPFKSGGEYCVQRIACEIGRENKDPQSRILIDKIIEQLSAKRREKWKSAIQGYSDGVQSQGVVLMSDSPNPPTTPIGPVYRHNLCLKYKCTL